jgi:hypothetical protein
MATQDVWSLYEQLVERDRASLNGAQRSVAAICDLRQEVSSGGFDSYFRYAGGDHAKDALTALPSVLGDAWAQLLREAMSVFGTDYPYDPASRGAVLDAADRDDELDVLDRRLHALEAASNADAALADFVERHPEVGRL